MNAGGSLLNDRVGSGEPGPCPEPAASPVGAPGGDRKVRPVRPAGRLVRRLLAAAGLGAVLFLAGEVTARLDDWLRLGVPFLATPDSDRDLIVWTETGMRGRPHGRFKKWELNEFGFRGPEIRVEPTPGVPRVMVMGASETFGMYESPSKEFPSQLGEQLAQSGRYEVVNTAVVGMTVNSMYPYWEHHVARFRPDLVIIYPSPQFYLHDRAPGRVAEAPKAADGGKGQKAAGDGHAAGAGGGFRLGWSSSRFLFRLKDRVQAPDVIQDWRDERSIRARTAAKPPDWVFRTVPRERLDNFTDDLERLVKAIRAGGATPLLLTHAFGATDPSREEDRRHLRSLRTHITRASDEVIPQFEEAARRRVLELAGRHGVECLDVAEFMNGRREYFADAVHFTDAGAEVLARRLAGRAAAVLASPPAPTRPQ